jgi:cytochrome c-type biogenesis protein CcmH
MRTLALVTIVALLTASAACDRNIEPFVPGEEPRQPDLSRIFPAPDDEALDPNSAPSTRSQPRPAGASIRGRVVVAPGHEGAAPADGVLFIIARPGAVQAGPPLAVVRIAAPRFPLDYEIGAGDIMMQGMRFEGELELSARLDTDGNATTRLPSELGVRLAGSVTPGSRDVELVLTQGGAESAPRSRAVDPALGSESASPANGQSIKGTIRLAPGRSAPDHSGSTLFVIARPAGVPGGPPLAVLRTVSPAWPLDFEIGQANVMVPGRRFEGSIDLSARLDSDGDAMTRDAGDPQAKLTKPVTPGNVGIELVLE